ncbi:hypothetical protein I6N90_06980 [Paenibacillus sp. GSMTC-2017]|uniref:hypothetical protein n=1 Tax=Paenibacillus sp. GSMTC-2017 TaxID=2794350 RepID=UPI0018D8A731|nr:hypothetical protein [Paenibacillus sp. GSMTC-2017]MBH5317560.1 hypothetical protein [Paenibacillus sp. GSMTC-2017]
MYIPKNSQFNPAGTSTTSDKPAQKKKLYSIAIAFGVLAITLIAGIMISKAESESELAIKIVPNDLEQLWKWSDEVLVEGAGTAEWTLRWDFTTTSKTALKELTASLFQEENGDIPNKLITNEGKTVRGEVERLGGLLSIHAPDETEQSNQLFVLLESSNATRTLQQLLSSAALIGDELIKVTSHANTSMKVHGFARSQEVVKEMERLSLGRVVEEYKDKGTWSVTLDSSSLLSSQPLGSDRYANLQVAAHEHTERKMTELTMGIPLITGDFASTKDEP